MSQTRILRRIAMSLLVMSGATQACSCFPGSFGLLKSLERFTAAALGVGKEITPQYPRDDNDAPRYWEANIIDLFKGCGLGSSGRVVIRTGGSSAQCGSFLKESTLYLLIGQASKEWIKELNYNGPILSIDSCTFQKQWADVTTIELQILIGLGEPKCEAINCDTCPQGFFDGCNNCFCSATGLIGCTKEFCPPGRVTEATCNCGADVKTCPDGTTVGRNRRNNCEFESCPEPPPMKCCNPLERPGFGNNPIGCKDGFQCCPDGQWSCSIGDGKTFPCGGKLITNGFGKTCDVPIVCSKDVLECPDGTFVGRDPKNDCKFETCDAVAVFCTADVKTCPDGSVVSRNPGMDCAFDPCPPPLDCKTCPFGYFDGCNTCGCTKDDTAFCTLRACGPLDLGKPSCNPNPDPVLCSADAKVCFDGSSVGRDPSNNCEFVSCPPPNCKICPYGYNDGCNDCQCNKAGNARCSDRACLIQEEAECFPKPSECTDDTFECPGGTFVSRDPTNHCQFKKCPTPPGCYDLDSCYLVDLTKNPKSEQKLQGGDQYDLLEGQSEYSIYCTVNGTIDRVTFYYPNGDKDRHVEWNSPWYMRGDSAGRINSVPYLVDGCGTKNVTVEGRRWKNICFSVNMVLEAVCYYSE